MGRQKGRKRKNRKEYPLLELIEEKERETKELLAFYSSLKAYIKEWRERDDVLKVLYACPPGTPLEKVVDLTYRYTDVPPSVSFYFMLVLMGAKFTQMDFALEIESQLVRPNLWVLTLDSSGSGKTYATKHICQEAVPEGDIEFLPETGTAAGYVKLLAEHPEKARALFFRDEVAQLFRILRKDTYVDLKDFFLRAYDGGPIERHTKKDGLMKVRDVFISFYGTTVLETFARSLKEEDLLDGFMQRFLVHIPEEVKKVVPLYVIPKEELENTKREYHRLIESLSGAPRRFKLTSQAREVYERWFLDHFNEELKSYYRRYLFSSMKLALIYKLMLYPKERDDMVDKEHMGWALRVVSQNLDSLYTLMSEYMSFDEYDLLIKRVERYIDSHPGCTRREVVQNVYGLKTVSQLDTILELLAEKGNEEAERLLKSRRRRK